MGTVFFGMQYVLDEWNESNKVTPQKLAQLMMDEDKKAFDEMREKTMERLEFRGNFTGLDFSEWNLSNIVFDDSSFAGANLTKANLFNSSFKNVNLNGAHLEESNLDESDLEGAFMGAANLKNASLRVANLKDAHMMGANLQGVNLEFSNLKNIDLFYATLEGANLYGVQNFQISEQEAQTWKIIIDKSNRFYDGHGE